MMMSLVATTALKRRAAQWVVNVLLSFYHDLLPPPATTKDSPLRSDSPSLLIHAAKARCTRIGFLRHGKTSPTPQGGHDFDRLLTEEGRKQAASAGMSFGKDLVPFYGLLASPAPRTMETARLFLDASGDFSKNNTVAIQPVQHLYDGAMQPEGSQLFRKIGYAPLKDYVYDEDPQDQETARRVLGSYAHCAIQSIVDALVRGSDAAAADGTTLWVVGHAVYLPAAALAIASLAGCDEDSMDIVMSTNTREAEGYLIDLKQSSVRQLERSA